ncbi:MAG: hypothetical protein ACJ77L_20755 [Solirubrobacteraceae bacterium]
MSLFVVAVGAAIYLALLAAVVILLARPASDGCSSPISPAG